MVTTSGYLKNVFKKFGDDKSSTNLTWKLQEK